MFANYLQSGLIRGFGTYEIKDPDILDKAVNNGYNFFDTACLYRNEKIVVDTIKKHSNKLLFVSTKISYIAIEKGQIEKNFYERLKLFDGVKIHCLLLHKPSDNCRRDWEILCALYEKHRDKIDHIGVSNYDIKHLEQLNDFPKPFCNQVELSPFYSRKELIDYCRKEGIVIIAHTSLTRCIKFDNPVIMELSSRYKITAVQLLLKWAKQNEYLTIPRTSRVEHLLENIKEMEYSISEEDMTLLNNLNENFALTKVFY